MVLRETKEELLGQKGVVLWFTGLSGSGKSTVACTLEHALAARGKMTVLLDGDNVRHGLNKNLGFRCAQLVWQQARRFHQQCRARAAGTSTLPVRCRMRLAACSAEDREENIRRIGEVSKLFAESGIITLTSFISPYRKDRCARAVCRLRLHGLQRGAWQRRHAAAAGTWCRENVRARMAAGDFVECYMRIPIEVCEQRDPKGLYKAARAGKIKGFTGIDDPCEGGGQRYTWDRVPVARSLTASPCANSLAPPLAGRRGATVSRAGD